MAKEKIEFAGALSAAEAAQYLESLAKGIRERAMLVESGDSSVTVQVPEEVKVEIELNHDPDKGKTDLDIGVSWRVRREVDVAPAPGLLIVPGAAPAETAAFVE